MMEENERILRPSNLICHFIIEISICRSTTFIENSLLFSFTLKSIFFDEYAITTKTEVSLIKKGEIKSGEKD